MTTPELMDSLGLTKEALIKQHLRSLLSATTTKVIISKGKAKKVSIPNWAVRRRALDMAFQLHGAYLPAKAKENYCVDVIISDMPRPDYSKDPVDIPMAPMPKDKRPGQNQGPKNRGDLPS